MTRGIRVPSAGTRAFVATSLDDVAHLIDAWDELAVEARNPYAAPAWVLAWWRHVASERAVLQLLVVTDEAGLVGIAPFFIDNSGGLRRFGLLGAATASRSTMLARGALETLAARCFVELLLSGEHPLRLMVLDGVPDDAVNRAFLAELRATVPSLHIRQEYELPTPAVSLDAGSYDEWLRIKSRNFRQQARRRRRQLDALGARFHTPASDAELAHAVAEFSKLHHERWRWRGGSGVLTPAVEAAVLDAARTLMPLDRFRLWSLDVDGKTVASMAFFGAGGELAWWLGGFDDTWSKYQPGIVTMLAAIEDAFEKGDARVNLGAGGQDMKQRFAEPGPGSTLRWLTITTSPVHRSVGWLLRAGPRARLAVSARLSDSQRRRLRTLAQKLDALRSRRNAS